MMFWSRCPRIPSPSRSSRASSTTSDQRGPRQRSLRLRRAPHTDLALCSLALFEPGGAPPTRVRWRRQSARPRDRLERGAIEEWPCTAKPGRASARGRTPAGISWLRVPTRASLGHGLDPRQPSARKPEREGNRKGAVESIDRPRRKWVEIGNRSSTDALLPTGRGESARRPLFRTPQLFAAWLSRRMLRPSISVVHPRPKTLVEQLSAELERLDPRARLGGRCGSSTSPTSSTRAAGLGTVVHGQLDAPREIVDHLRTCALSPRSIVRACRRRRGSVDLEGTLRSLGIAEEVTQEEAPRSG